MPVQFRCEERLSLIHSNGYRELIYTGSADGMRGLCCVKVQYVWQELVEAGVILLIS